MAPERGRWGESLHTTRDVRQTCLPRQTLISVWRQDSHRLCRHCSRWLEDKPRKPAVCLGQSQPPVSGGGPSCRGWPRAALGPWSRGLGRLRTRPRMTAGQGLQTTAETGMEVIAQTRADGAQHSLTQEAKVQEGPSASCNTYTRRAGGQPLCMWLGGRGLQS